MFLVQAFSHPNFRRFFYFPFRFPFPSPSVSYPIFLPIFCGVVVFQSPWADTGTWVLLRMYLRVRGIQITIVDHDQGGLPLALRRQLPLPLPLPPQAQAQPLVMESQRRYTGVSDPSRRPSPAQAGSAGRSVQGDATAPPGHPGSQGGIGYHYSQGPYVMHQPPGVGPSMRSPEPHSVGVSGPGVAAQRLPLPGYAVPPASGGRPHQSGRVSSPDYRGYQHAPQTTPVAAASAVSSGSPASGAPGAAVVAVDSSRSSVGVVYGGGPGGVADSGATASVAQHLSAHQKHSFGGPPVGSVVAGSGGGIVGTGGSGSAGSVSHSTLSGRQGVYGMNQPAGSPQRQPQQHHHSQQHQRHLPHNYRGGVQQQHQVNSVPPPPTVYKSPVRGPYTIPSAVTRAPPQGAPWQPNPAGSGHGVPSISSGHGVGDTKPNPSAKIASKVSSPAGQDNQNAPGASKGGAGHRQQLGSAEAVGGGPGNRGGSGGTIDGGGGNALSSPTRGDNNFQEQMSPSALQAINQMTKVSRSHEYLELST